MVRNNTSKMLYFAQVNGLKEVYVAPKHVSSYQWQKIDENSNTEESQPISLDTGGWEEEEKIFDQKQIDMQLCFRIDNSDWSSVVSLRHGISKP
eukprot:UN16504